MPTQDFDRIHGHAYTVSRDHFAYLNFSHFRFNFGFLMIFPCLDLDLFSFKPGRVSSQT
jgi:hypothetical protein